MGNITDKSQQVINRNMSALQDPAISPCWTTSRADCYALIDAFRVM